MSLLATAVTVYHYLATKVTPLQLPLLFSLPLLPLLIFSFFLSIFLPTLAVKANSLKYTWKTWMHWLTHASLIQQLAMHYTLLALFMGIAQIVAPCTCLYSRTVRTHRV